MTFKSCRAPVAAYRAIKLCTRAGVSVHFTLELSMLFQRAAKWEAHEHFVVALICVHNGSNSGGSVDC